MTEQMTLEQYRQKVEEHLLKLSKSPAGTRSAMQRYEDDLKDFYEENFSVEATATGILMGLL